MSEWVNFLGVLFSVGLSYGAICVARSALLNYLDCKDAAQFGEHKRVRQFVKGIFEKRLALPKYSSTWDVDIVLQYLHYPHDELTLKELFYKLVMLLAVLSGQQCQTLHCLSVSSVKMSNSKCMFTVDVLLKRSHKGKHLVPLEFLAFPQNQKLCIVSVLSLLKEYLRRTKEIWGEENKLLPSYPALHKPVSKTLWPDGSDKCLTEQVLALHNLVHIVHVQPVHRQHCPVVCQWTLCYEQPDGAQSQHLPGSAERNQQYGASPVGFLSPQKLE